MSEMVKLHMIRTAETPMTVSITRGISVTSKQKLEYIQISSASQCQPQWGRCSSLVPGYYKSLAREQLTCPIMMKLF